MKRFNVLCKTVRIHRRYVHSTEMELVMKQTYTGIHGRNNRNRVDEDGEINLGEDGDDEGVVLAL